MRNINLKLLLWIILSLSVLIWFGLAFATNVDPSKTKNFIKLLPNVVTIDVIIISVFAKWLWQWKLLHGWLVPFPNLNGTWKGFINSTWIDPKTKKRPNQIPVIVTINQSFFKISCVMRTAEMTSHSIASDFILDKDNQLKRLVYSYLSNPIQTIKERSPQHYGTIVFDIIEKPERKLVGEYWADRKTTGQIELIFWKKIKLEHYPKIIGEHPVSKNREL
jgi:hypothetical protein